MKMNVAILGAGNIARQMAVALKGINDEVCLYAVASRSYDKAKEFADKWGFEKAYGSYEELAADDKVDLIYVATPHSEHYKNTLLCLEHGRNCLVEKAFCGNRTQSEKLIKYAKEKKILLTEAMWTRYQPSKDLIREIIESGELGEVSYLESDFSVPMLHIERVVRPELAGGALLDLGVYSLTVAAMYFGTNIKSVKFEVTKLDSGVDGTTIVYLEYNDGKKAKAKCSAIDSESNYAKIVGDKGYMVFGPINVPTKIDIFDNEGKLKRSIDIPLIANGYEYQVLECKEALCNGKIETVSMPHSETIRLMGWMDSVRDHAGIVYPFETEADIHHEDYEVWGTSDVK